MKNELNINILSINVNSFNVCTMDRKNSKTLLKIEGVTGKKPEIILLTDVRAANRTADLSKMFSLTRHGSYKIDMNLTKDSRGVAIAVKRNIFHEIIDCVKDVIDENYILLKMTYKGVPVTIGCVYGPNGNNPMFFKDIKRQLVRLGGCYILGWDMNTILCSELGDDNLDKIGGGRIPNVQNSRELNDWIRDGFAVDPFRIMYPLEKEVSYIPFRTRQGGGIMGQVEYSKTRLDFFMMSPELIDRVTRIVYEDRLGADFDHKGVNLVLGMKAK
jgi:exonuclease III